jgi:hypothetical protein
MNCSLIAETWTNARYRGFFFDQRAAAARRARALRASADTPSQRALPPFGPPFLPPMRPRVRNASRAAASSFTFGRPIVATVARAAGAILNLEGPSCIIDTSSHWARAAVNT